MQIKELFKRIDWYLILLMMSLVGVGILAINSATAYSGNIDVVRMQIIYFAVGFILMIIVMSFDYHFIGNWYMIIYGLTIVLLLAVILF